jgi:hypothetical protein
VRLGEVAERYEKYLQTISMITKDSLHDAVNIKGKIINKDFRQLGMYDYDARRPPSSL